MLKTAVLISGRGSNMQALLDDMKQPNSPYRVSVVISNTLEAPGLDKALTKEELRDLMTYLLTEPPPPKSDGKKRDP